MKLFSLFLLARPPILGSRQSACLNCSPAPGRGRSERRSVCCCGRDGGLLASHRVMPLSRYRSFAVDTWLVCGDVPIAPCLVICLVCLIAQVYRSPVFLIKAFQRIRCPRLPFLLISSSRSSLHHPISSACCSLGSRRCRLVSVISSSRAICLLAARRSVLRSVMRPAHRPVLPWMMSSTLCSIAPHAVRLAIINRPALLVGWLGAGRDGEPISSSFARLVAVACLLGHGTSASVPIAATCLLTRSAGRFVSVVCWRNCIYDLSCCYNIM